MAAAGIGPPMSFPSNSTAVSSVRALNSYGIPSTSSLRTGGRVESPFFPKSNLTTYLSARSHSTPYKLHGLSTSQFHGFVHSSSPPSTNHIVYSPYFWRNHTPPGEDGLGSSKSTKFAARYCGLAFVAAAMSRSTRGSPGHSTCGLSRDSSCSPYALGSVGAGVGPVGPIPLCCESPDDGGGDCPGLMTTTTTTTTTIMITTRKTVTMRNFSCLDRDDPHWPV
mmetsp:Transcript_53277/g.159515  ORF Transcript_53277/g.159515 Transcript_53277/m.159515 type:complete len:223 (+) Transcript_53277:530-1198(+)